MKTLFCLCVFLFAGACLAAQNTSNFYKVRLAKVIDGDTFKVYLACRYKVFCRAISVRVRGIDTPELKSQDPEQKSKAYRARAYARKFLNSGPIRLKNCTRDKYFRLLCDVYVNDYSLAERLLSAGLAVPYIEKSKKSLLKQGG